MALAGFAIALGPGHNVPFFIARAGLLGPIYLWPKIVTLLLAPLVVSAVILVNIERRLRHRTRAVEEFPAIRSARR